ncbi:MAG: hypothetical protein NVS9B14_07770 [Candidatus Acidiferrum sp.]
MRSFSERGCVGMAPRQTSFESWKPNDRGTRSRIEKRPADDRGSRGLGRGDGEAQVMHNGKAKNHSKQLNGILDLVQLYISGKRNDFKDSGVV